MGRAKKKWLGAVALLSAFVAVAYGPIERRVAAVRLLTAMEAEDKTKEPALGKPVTDLKLSGGEPIAARVYGPPAEQARLSIVLAHGIHYKGINEPRLIRFARHLGSLGCRVLTPELADLADYRITESGVDVLRASVDYMADQSGTDVGLIGFSFAGGLSLIAAEQPDTAKRLKYVASVGGYHDLQRSLRFLATNRVEGPEGVSERKAHEYGLLVLLYGNLKHFDLGPDEEVFGRALGAWLRENRKLARQQAEQLTTPTGRQLFELVEGQNVGQLQAQILPLLVNNASQLKRLSPRGRLGAIQTQMIFLHGTDDTVVPPEETLFASVELQSAKAQSHHSLVTPLLRHVGVDRPAGMSAKLELVNLMSHLL